jgi:CheY-like chemotaxis protein
VLRRRVLLIDDNPESLAVTAVLIRKLGHEVEVASGTTAALMAARRLAPHVIFIDLAMPGVDGVALTKELKADPAAGTSRIYMLTGHSDERARVRAYEAGCAGYFVKPLDPAALESLLGR